MGNGNTVKTPLNGKNETVIPQNKELEKKTGKSYINSFLGKFELFERKEINITLKNPILNIEVKIKILNEEKLDNILYDYYPNYNLDLIPTLNGYILSKEDSLRGNNIQDKDDIYVSEPLNFNFLFSDNKNDNVFPVKASKYQIFFDVFQRFRLKDCPKEYKYRLSQCYYKEMIINNFDIIQYLNIENNDYVFVMLGKDDNTKCLYDQGLEALKRFNFIYINQKENKINLNDIKIELNDKILDEEELNNFKIINFTNLKYLSLNDCKIQRIYFLNSMPLSNLLEVNLKNNNISYFDNLSMEKLEIMDLSYNNLSKNMLYEKNKNKIIHVNLPSLKILNLSHNKIEDLNILCQFKIESLHELCLNNNEIEDIKVFNNVTCGKLKRLYLSNNKINDISVFNQLSFCNNIREINLMNNEIVNINSLRNINLPRLKILNILNNDITDYSVLQLIFLPKLEILYAFPSQLDPNNYDKSSEVYNNFINSCDNIIEKNVEIKYKL